jgi:hypothetical protein
MAKFLIRLAPAENPQRYTSGDIICIVDDEHVWGRYESKEQWVAEGLDPTLWPDVFGIIEFTGLDTALAQPYLESIYLDGTIDTEIVVRRKYGVDIAAAMALLNTSDVALWQQIRHLTLSWGNAAVQDVIKTKVL